MYLRKNYSWGIDVTTFELNVIRKCLRNEDLNDAEDAAALKLASTMDTVYQDKCGNVTNKWTNDSSKKD